MITYREKAGEARYDRGMALMANNDKMSFRQAYVEFQSALGFLPGDLNVRQKMDEAYSYAVVNVVVLPVEERGSYQYSSYNTRYRGFDANILRYLQQHNGNQFVKYYTPIEARNKNIRPDQFVDVRFTSFNIGHRVPETKMRTVTKEVVVKETVYRPDSVVKEYKKVQARIITTRTTMTSQGRMQVIVRDNDNRTAWNSSFDGQHFWTTEHSIYTGDERALTESDKILLNKAQENPPHDGDIIRCIIDEIQSKLECGLKDYFNRF